MKIFTRHFTSVELVVFVFAYMFSNFLLVRMQQRWRQQQEDEFRMKAVRQIGLAGSVQLVKAPDDDVRRMHVTGDRSSHDTDIDKIVSERPEFSPDTDAPLVTESTRPERSPVNEDREKEQRPVKGGRRARKKDGFKTILFWNTFFHSEDFRFGLGHQPFLENKCPVHQCRTTLDKRELDRADLVMFHGPRINNFPPPRRPSGQLYAYVQQEPHYALSVDEMDEFNGLFNLTVTHRRNSDVWIPYGRVTYDRRKAGRPTTVDPRDKPRSIVWVVSHCSTPGKREWYVQELQKYIDVDIYGDCGDMQCSKDDARYCYEKFAKEYRFYMALENNHCKDYVSEKAFRPLEYDIVPVVFGGANYSHFMPPHSVIDIEDYPHPKQLAQYLHLLSDNERAYSRYFSWKAKGYGLELSRKVIMGQAFCRICEILHDPSYQFTNYDNLKDWWTRGTCDSYVIPRMRRKAKW